MYKNKINHGFSLLELMIVIAIIGVLSSIAIPTYNDYLIRTRIAEMLVLAQPVKLAFSEYALIHGQFTTLKANNDPEKLAEIGAEPQLINGNNHMVQSISVKTESNGTDFNGIIIIKGNTEKLKLSDLNQSLYLYLKGQYNNYGLTWSCEYNNGISNNDGNLSKYVPANCRTLSKITP